MRSRRKCWFVVAGGTEENRDRDLNSRLHEETAGTGCTVHHTRIVVRELAPRISKSQIYQGFDSDYTNSGAYFRIRGNLAMPLQVTDRRTQFKQ